LLASGDEKSAETNYREALTVAEGLAQRAPSSLYLRRQHADALESLGRHYSALARHRPEFRAEARHWLQKSLTVWQDCTRRNIAAPYASKRAAAVVAMIASIDRM
jgi:hypothetical protein